MADKTIDDFNAVVTPATTDVLIISQANVAKKETVAQLDTLLSATTKTLTNKTLTSPVINTSLSGTAIDTDGTLAANSDTKVASQKAVKTYADTKQTLATALTALAALTPAEYTLPVFSSASSATSVVISEQTLLGRITGGLVAALTSTQVRTLLNITDGANVSKVVQTVGVQTGAVATGTTAIPNDDTIPQNTEGDEYMSLAITPTDVNNYLEIDVVVHVSHSAVDPVIVALFQDATANALAVGADSTGDVTTLRNINFKHRMLAGTVAATTFKIRAGASTGATTTFNGVSGNRFYGGILASSINIKEVKP